MDTIYLWNNDRNGWQADFRDSTEAAKMLDLFGTTVVPTAYTSSATFERVVSGLRQNPNNTNTRFIQEMRTK